MRAGHLLLGAALLGWTLPAAAAEYPKPQGGDWVARDFRFHSGEVMPELKLHYTTIGNSSGEPVLMLHGTASSAESLLTPSFAGELFGPGQPLDAARYYIILPDSLGAGKSSKPSDGLRASFPRYNYDDMVQAQYRLLTEGLGIQHVRVVMGNSMGGMHAWLWGVQHPGFMDALVPMASQPTDMASRNWALRRMLVETIKRDPAYQGGNYTVQPPIVATANAFFGLATSGGTLAYQAIAPTAAAADRLVDTRLAVPAPMDANDFVYQWESSHDFTAAAGLERIEAPVLAINAADDERNPPESGLMEQSMQRLKHGTLVLIPASADTRGHGTTGIATFYKQRLQEFLAKLPPRAM